MIPLPHPDDFPAANDNTHHVLLLDPQHSERIDRLADFMRELLPGQSFRLPPDMLTNHVQAAVVRLRALGYRFTIRDDPTGSGHARVWCTSRHQ